MRSAFLILGQLSGHLIEFAVRNTDRPWECGLCRIWRVLGRASMIMASRGIGTLICCITKSTSTMSWNFQLVSAAVLAASGAGVVVAHPMMNARKRPSIKDNADRFFKRIIILLLYFLWTLKKAQTLLFQGPDLKSGATCILPGWANQQHGHANRCRCRLFQFPTVVATRPHTRTIQRCLIQKQMSIRAWVLSAGLMGGTLDSTAPRLETGLVNLAVGVFAFALVTFLQRKADTHRAENKNQCQHG